MAETSSFVEKYIKRCVFLGIACVLSLFVLVGYLQNSFPASTTPLGSVIVSVLDNNRYGNSQGGLLINAPDNGTLDPTLLKQQILQGSLEIKVVHLKREITPGENDIYRPLTVKPVEQIQPNLQSTPSVVVSQQNRVQETFAGVHNIPQKQPQGILPSIVPIIGDTVKDVYNQGQHGSHVQDTIQQSGSIQTDLVHGAPGINAPETGAQESFNRVALTGPTHSDVLSNAQTAGDNGKGLHDPALSGSGPVQSGVPSQGVNQPGPRAPVDVPSPGVYNRQVETAAFPGPSSGNHHPPPAAVRPGVSPAVGTVAPVGKPGYRTNKPPAFAFSTASGKRTPVCENLLRPDPAILGDPLTVRWQPVTGHDVEYFAISAFWDKRYHHPGFHLVRVMAVGDRWNNKDISTGVYCQIWPKGGGKAVWIPSVKYLNREHHERKYATVIFKCTMDDSVEPEMVSLVLKECDTATNLLRVIDTGVSEQAAKRDLSICVSGPLHYHYADGNQFINFIEANLALGVNYFYFYNHSASPVLLPYMEKYTREGVIQVIQWKVPQGLYVSTEPPPTERQPDVHYFGQVAALQDCHYRALSSTKFLVNLDLDELIIPTEGGSLIDLLSTQLDASNPRSKHGAYVIPSSFFPATQPGSGPYTDNADVAKYVIRPLFQLQRESLIYPYEERSKYIVHPERVEVLGIHFIYAFVGDTWGTCNVPPEKALVHHHRDSGLGRVPTLIKDDTALKFADSILQRVKETHRQLQA